MPKPEIRDKLPVHQFDRTKSTSHKLRVDGLVGQPLELTIQDLQAMSQTGFTDEFSCREGWTVPDVNWKGVTLESVLGLAQPNSQARWVQASAGEFSIPIKLEDAPRAIIATRIGEEALPVAHGGPMRLVVAGGDCFTSVKWIDHLELRAEAAPNTGEAIAMARLKRSRVGE